MKTETNVARDDIKKQIKKFTSLSTICYLYSVLCGIGTGAVALIARNDVMSFDATKAFTFLAFAFVFLAIGVYFSRKAGKLDDREIEKKRKELHILKNQH